MSIAPEPYFSALTEVISAALLASRQWGWRGVVPAEHLAALMDAVHNIPEYLGHWELCDIEVLKQSYLGAYERKWVSNGGLPLLQIFNAALNTGLSPAELTVQHAGTAAGASAR